VGAASGILAITAPLGQRQDEVRSLTYTTEPLEADLEVNALVRGKM
jgi:hypothetical protein